MEIAVLLTCYNRKDKTINCLKSLADSLNHSDVYLVDDGSSDGTSKIVSNLFPDVRIITGNGNLFWNRGMHKAWDIASRKKEYDYYLLLNNDVILYQNCFNELFQCSSLKNDSAIISGIIQNENGSCALYGGSNRSGKQLQPNGELQNINGLNGNVVLIPKKVFNILGNLDKFYHHDLGDLDYGLRAKKAGLGVFTTRIPVAIGTPNSICRVRQNRTTVVNRFRKLYSPLGSNPKINFYFRKRHFGIINAILFYIFQHFLVIIPDPLNEILFKNKYQ